MSGYRQMRRQARHARKAGMQPMMIINGDQFPTPLAAILARWAWHYRSELAPLTTAVAVLGAGTWVHVARPYWWPYLTAGTIATALALGTLGGYIGLTQRIERAYAATATLSAGIWLAVACLLGPFTSPLPQVLGLGTLALGIPWWAHRRRRAKVRVERSLAVWPDISKAIGLVGSQVQSATVDLWGWRARLRLARGQTIDDATARIPAIESALGTFRGAVRIYPTPDDKANRCELRVLDTDPHADAIPWPGPSARTITQPIDLGPFEDADPCRVLFLRRHALFAGTTGSGKSGGLNVLMGSLAACEDVVIWAIDLKKGMELQPWAPCIDRLATTPDEAAALLADAVAILQARAEWLASTGRRVWEPSPDAPALVIVIDEYAELADDAPDAMSDTDSIARLGRAVAVTLVAATQRPTQKAMGQGAVRSQMDTRICFRVRERRDVDLILGQGMLNSGWHAHTLNAPGKFLVSAPGHDTPRRARAYLVTDDDVARTAAQYAASRPGLDPVSLGARAEPGPAGARPAPWYLTDPHVGAAGYVPADARSAPDEPGDAPDTWDAVTPEAALWAALRAASQKGADITELMRNSGLGRSTVYRYLGQFADTGRAEQVGWGRWRAITNDGGGHDE
jgi:S-DNA-T family DNA segregation ATPase FtsK/SpoIIIE